MRYLILALLLTGCMEYSAPSDPRTITGIDPAAVQYVQLFEGWLGSSIGDIPIGLTTDIQAQAGTSGDTVGVCLVWTYSGGAYKEIFLDQNFFNAQNDAGKTSLIFHELGHCVLNRAHNTQDLSASSAEATEIGYDAPLSWMYPTMFYTQSYEATDSLLMLYYQSEMFYRADFIPWLSYEMLRAASANDNDWIVHGL
jgi:hypothetical protein